MERKIIISLVSGYLVSMLPIWMIDSRMQDMKKALTSANVRAKRKNNLFK